jgi:hypothetical protein
MATNAYFIRANISSGDFLPLSTTDANPRTVQVTSAGAVYIAFGVATKELAAAAANAALITTNNVVTFDNVNLTTTWVRSQSAATVAFSYTYPTS